MYKTFQIKGKRYRIDLTRYVNFIGGAVIGAWFIWLLVKGM